MMKLNLLLTFLLLTAISASAQFYKIPDWSQQIPLRGELTAIGISDPRIEDDSLAALQADVRAKALIAMMNSTNIAYTSEHFQSETEEHRTYKLEEIVEKLGRFKARLPYHPDDFERIETIANQNNEHMVLMAYADNGESKPNVLNVYCEMYSKEYEVSNTRSYAVAELIELRISDSTENGVRNYTYNFEFDGHDYEISSVTNGVRTEPPGYSYAYSKTSDLYNIGEFDASENLKKGLWQAFIRSYIYAVSEDSKNYDSKIKNLEDMFREGREDIDTYEDATLNQELSRQVVKNTMNFYLHGMEVDQNMLYLNITTPLLDEDPPKKWIKPVVMDTIVITPCKRTFWDWLLGRNKCE